MRHADVSGAGDTTLPTWAALTPILVAIAGLATNFWLMGMTALDGPNQLVLIVAGLLMALIAKLYGVSWNHVQGAIVAAISGTLASIIIILIIGALITSWFLGGIVPSLIYYGIQVISPDFFYVTATLICCVASLAMGSSWSTTATVGVALFGVGQALGVHAGMSVGAIISGAYFGDKMSPMSDTTNLAAASAKVDLFRHIAYMHITTLPAMFLTLTIFLISGLAAEPATDTVMVSEIATVLQENYTINPWLLTPPLLVVIAIKVRIPALPSLVLATVLGVVAALLTQGDLIARIAVHTGPWTNYVAVMKALSMGFQLPTEEPAFQRVLRAGGMAGMLPTIWLIISAMIFGGALEGTGALNLVTAALLKVASMPGRLIAATAGASFLTNMTAADHFLAIVVPAKLFAPAYQAQNLAPENLSRTLEDAGTVTSPLIPWNTCGAFQASLFAVDPLSFIPYCLFNLLSPIMSVVVGFVGFRLARPLVNA